MDKNPTWSPDGKTLYFASDRTGIFNIYAHTVASGELKQVTNVRTGAYAPTISEDGKLMVYMGYSAQGWDLWSMPLDPDTYLEAPPSQNDRPDPYDEPPAVKMEKYPFRPWGTLRPRAWEWEISEGDYGSTALTIGAFGSDIIGRHSFGATMFVEPLAPGPELTFNYNYGRLPFDLGLRVFNRWTPRGDYRFDDEVRLYNEESYGVRTAISYAHRHEFVTQGFSMAYTGSINDGELPVDDLRPFDPFASRTIEPFHGYIGTLRFGYEVSSLEGRFAPIGTARGWALNLALEMGDEFTGSEESLYAATYAAAGYVPMPWPGSHTLAIRSAGGMATGSFARRTLFFVGGYNLENVGFPETITSTQFSGAFVMRGYLPSTYRGSNYMLNTFEYRFPIVDVDRGIETLPLFLKRVSGNLFLDWGGAWRELDFDDIKLFHKGSLIEADEFHTGMGAELWFSVDLGYVVPVNIRLGYAKGFSVEAVPGGQGYFIAASPF